MTPQQRDEIVRLFGRGQGRPTIRRRTGLTDWQVWGVLQECGLRRSPNRELKWTCAQDAYLREHAGEQGVPRIAREVSRLGPTRQPAAVRVRLCVLGLGGSEGNEEGGRRYLLPDLRQDLTVERVARLTGRDTETVMRRIERKELSARKEDGAYRIWPSALRDFLTRDKRFVDRTKVQDWEELQGLLLGEWGVTEETERKKASKARRAAAEDAA